MPSRSAPVPEVAATSVPTTCLTVAGLAMSVRSGTVAAVAKLEIDQGDQASTTRACAITQRRRSTVPDPPSATIASTTADR